MIVRAALLVLAVLVVLAVLKRWRQPRVSGRSASRQVEAARKCPTCDAYVLGATPAPCARPDCRFR